MTGGGNAVTEDNGASGGRTTAGGEVSNCTVVCLDPESGGCVESPLPLSARRVPDSEGSSWVLTFACTSEIGDRLLHVFSGRCLHGASKELNRERADTPAPTTWPLGVTAFRLFVLSQPPVSHDRGLTKLDKI